MAKVRSKGALASAARSTGVWAACLALLIALVPAPANAAPASAPASVAASAPTGVTAGIGGPVKAADLSLFRPGNIISDAVFFASGTMTAGQIQAFLDAKVPRCEPGYVCLKDWYDTSRTTTADAMCGAYAGGIRERASTIIHRVAQACGINPQVLLVMLQKEQGLVTHVWPSDWRYTIAMGQGCPDTAACDTRYYGFFNQVYGAAWQMKRYMNPPGTSQLFTWYAPGKTWNVRFHPEVSCGSSPVLIQNQATANLYYYTPYQPNAAALRAGYGLGDGCSAYGNRNFYQYFTDWFGSTQAPANACAQPSSEQVTAATGEFAVNVATLNARSAPSTLCEPVEATLAAGAVVTRLAVFGDWWRVRHDKAEYWVHGDYLGPAPAVAYSVLRIAGPDRFETAVEISKKAYPDGAGTVFVASGEEYPDALTAGAAAGHIGGALLLTRATSIASSVTAEITRLAPQRIVIIGGETRVSPQIVSQIAKLVPGATVDRIAGTDRYETSRLIAAAFFGGAGTAYVVTGEKFPDALVAAGLGGALARPVVLVQGSQTAPDAATAGVLRDLGVTKVLIAGSVDTVSAGIGDELRAAGLTVERHGGRDRYATGRMLVAAAYANGAAAAVMATGENFPDALSGAVLAVRSGAPLLTTPRSCLDHATKDWLIRAGVTAVTLLGEAPSLSEAVAASVRC